MTDVLVVGESLVDIVRTADGGEADHAGGSAANVAVALARLGRSVRIATAFAADEHGALLRKRFERDGVGFAGDPEILERTSSALADIGPDGAASYTFDLDWHLGEVPLEPVPAVVHACSLGAVLEPGATQVAELLAALRPHATVSYDVNARPAVTGSGAETVARVERIVALADVVKASDEDLAALYPDGDPLGAARRLLDLGPRAVVVTFGAEGAAWVSRDREVRAPAVRGTVVDTIGAGDTFGAALIDALWRAGHVGAAARDALASLSEEEIAAVLGHAAKAAAVTVSRPGADPPYASEL